MIARCGEGVFYDLLIKSQCFIELVSWGCDLHRCLPSDIITPPAPLLFAFLDIGFPIFFLETLTFADRFFPLVRRHRKSGSGWIGRNALLTYGTGSYFFMENSLLL